MDTSLKQSNGAGGMRSTVIAGMLVVLAFALGFAEFVLIGIVPDVAQGLGEPLTLVGDIVGWYALACAVATPVVSLAAGRANRYVLTAVLLVIFNVGNLVTLAAGDYSVLLVSRMMAAATSGTLLALAMTYVPDVVPASKVARVLALVLAGFSVSSVIGVPIGASLADAFGWKSAYAVVFASGALVSASLLFVLPRAAKPDEEKATVLAQLRLLKDRRVLLNVAMILCGAASTYVFYTYLTPVLQDEMGYGAFAVSAILLAFGAACVISNIMSGWVANRFGLRGLPATFAVHGALLVLLAVTVPLGGIGVANIVFVGIIMYVMNSTVQMLFQTVARDDYPSAVTFSSSLHPMSFNAGIALGSFVGGIVVNSGGLGLTGPVGGLLAFAAAGIAVVLYRVVRAKDARSETPAACSAKPVGETAGGA